MDSDFCENIDQNYERRVYTAYINAGKAKSDKERKYTTFDDFPTTLAALGVQIEGNRLGLGTNLFSTEKTLTEIFGIEKENSELKHRSKLLDQLADVDEESEILKERENNTYSATIALGNYQHDSRSLPVRLSNIKGNQDAVEKILYGKKKIKTTCNGLICSGRWMEAILVNSFLGKSKSGKI